MRQRQSHLRALTAGQLAGRLVQRDVDARQPRPGQVGVPPPIQPGPHGEQVGHGEVQVQRGVLRDEADAGQHVGVVDRRLIEHPDAAGIGLGQAGDEMHQGGLAGAVRPDEGGHAPHRQGQRAVAQRPLPAVPLAQSGGLQRDAHARSSRSLPKKAARMVSSTSATMSSLSQPAERARRTQVDSSRSRAAWLASCRRAGAPHERAQARAGLDRSRQLQLPVRLQHGVGVDGQRLGHLAHGRQPVPRIQPAQAHRLFHLLHQLRVRGDPRVRVQPKLDHVQPLQSGITVVHYDTTTLRHYATIPGQTRRRARPGWHFHQNTLGSVVLGTFGAELVAAGRLTTADVLDALR